MKKEINFQTKAIIVNILEDIAQEKYGLELDQFMQMYIRRIINDELLADITLHELIMKRAKKGKYKSNNNYESTVE